MPFPPHAWTYEALTSTLLGLLEFKARPKAKITYPTAQSIPNGATTFTALTNNATSPTTLYDTDSMVDTTNRRIKITSPGWYVAAGVVALAGNSTGARKAQLRHNGAWLGGIYVEPDSAEPCLMPVHSNGPILCAAGDYFDLTAAQASGGALNTYNSTEGLSVLAVWMVDSSTS